jgi:hypothetical protein
MCSGSQAMESRSVLLPLAFLSLLATPLPGFAQGLDFTVWLGRAYPLIDGRLTLRPSPPVLPGLDIAETGPLEIRAAGGPVFGAALAFELGILAIEGRVDATDVRLDLRGARYDLSATAPFDAVTGTVIVGDGRFDVERLYLLSVNGRVRTPGAVSLVVSGGLSYLPDIVVTGSVPLAVEGPAFPDAGIQPRLQLRTAPGEPRHRFGVNGGVGLRAGGRVSLAGEVRVFYFREHGLRLGAEGLPGLVTELVDRVDPVRFEPIFVNAQVGLVFRF